MAEKSKVIAKTVIHRTIEPGKAGDRTKGIRPTPPKIQVIQPGTVFQTQSKEEYDQLMEAGAIRKPETGEKVAVAIENVVQEPGNGGKGKPARRVKTEEKSIADMTGTELDAHLESSEHEAPEGWSGMSVADKKAWLEKAEADGLV